jgi:hypothetical protein
MAAAAQQISQRLGEQISHQSTLLIDDDFKNIRAAMEYGVRCIHFSPDSADCEAKLQSDIANLQRVPTTNHFEGANKVDDGAVVLQLPSRFRSATPKKQRSFFAESDANKQHQIIAASGRPLGECLSISHLQINCT